MKPRLKRAPLTNEDMEIRRVVAWRLAHNILGASHYRIALVAADQRDADLMLYAQTNNKLGYVVMNTDRHAVNFLVWVRSPSAYDVRKYTE